MNKLIKYGIYIVTILIVLLLIYPDRIREIKHISNLDAENAITNQYLDHRGLKNKKSSNNILYTIIKIKPKKTSSPILKLSVKAGHAFYVFQNNHLTYSQQVNQYYKGFSNQNKYYNTIDAPFWKEKQTHQIPLHSYDPLYILIKKPRKKETSRFVDFPNIIQKDIKHLVSKKLPIIKINTHSNSLETSHYQFTSIDFLFNTRKYTSFAKMKIRGHTSLTAPKKKFNIIFEEPDEINGFMLKKNVLISSHIDRSFIRNKLADNLFSVFNGIEPSTMYTHLIINDFYEGLYLIAEHPEQQFKNLINDMDTNCFLLQIDRGPVDFHSKNSSQGYKCEYPASISSRIPKALNWFENNIGIEHNWSTTNTKASDPFNVRVDYIVDNFGLNKKNAKNIVKKADYIMNQPNHSWTQPVKAKAIKSGNTFYEQALEEANWLINKNNLKKNISSENHSINIRSFIDLIILNELSKNIDGYRLSTYLSYINNEFSVSIIWDFDLTWGLSKDNRGFDHDGFVINEMSQYLPSFWLDLWGNKAFQEKIKKRYIEMRLNTLSNKEIEKQINTIYNQIHPSTQENFERWQIIGQDIWPNKFHFKSHEKEVAYLKEWIFKRLSWLDAQWAI